MKFLLLLMATIVAVRADCDACINGWCHYREILIKGFLVTDKMAIDQINDILYVQLNHNLNTAYHLREHKICLVQHLNTTGMTVDQDTQILYTAQNHTIFKIAPGETPEIFFIKDSINPSVLHYGHDYGMYFLEKNFSHLCYIKDGESYYYNQEFIDASDVVSINNGDIYILDNNVVYLFEYNSFYRSHGRVDELKTLKNAKLSKYKDTVYVTDASANAIYKINEDKQFEEYAAYEGSIGQIVFDSNGSILFTDTAAGSVNRWRRGEAQCTFEMQSKYIIKKLPLNISADENTDSGIP